MTYQDNSYQDYRPGGRVRLHSGRDTGTVTIISPPTERNIFASIQVVWDTGRTAWQWPHELVILADDQPPTDTPMALDAEAWEDA